MPRVFVSIGSNVDRERNIQGALEALTQRFGPLAVSTIYETAAVGFDGQPFYNLVVGFDSDESVDAIRAELRRIEDAHGRRRNGVPKFSSRTLDLDLLLCGDVVDHAAQLPHPDVVKYAFVLGPLAELAPDLCHPELGQSIAELWRRFAPEQRTLKPAPVRVALPPARE
jgi:2-amino-4-hydroxy-6-hydroxymethyldihydropteridine diphosphokinase